MSLILVEIELNQGVILEELGFFLLMVLYKYFQFVHQKSTNQINKQHGALIVCMALRGSGKFVYDNFFDVIHDINITNAEVFVKGLEKCEHASRLLGQNVENLDDSGSPTVQDLIVADEGRNVFWIRSSYHLQHISRLHFAERKENV